MAIGIAVGVAIGWAIQRYLLRGPAVSPGPSGHAGSQAQQGSAADSGDTPASSNATAPAVPGPTPAPGSDLTSRLLPLREALDRFGKSSAHPRELGDREEFRQALALLADAQVPLDAVLDYALGANTGLACAAFGALAQRADRDAALGSVLPHLTTVEDWALYFALPYLASLTERPPVGAAVARPNEYWSDQPLVCSFFAAYFRKRAELGDVPTFGPLLDAKVAARADAIDTLLAAIDHPSAKALAEELRAWRGRTLNRAWLSTFGRFWPTTKDELLIEHSGLREPLAHAEGALLHSPPRSLLIVGDARGGKTALVRLIAQRLATQGYVVFEASAAELMAGQSYFGELEGRLRRLLEEIASDKRVIWYIPDFTQMLTSGRHQGQSASVLDQVLPAIAGGRVIAVSECTPGALTNIHQTRPAVRNAMDVVRTRAVSAEEAGHIAREFAARLVAANHLSADADVVPASMQLAAQYFGSAQLPGAVLDLLNATVKRALEKLSTRLTRYGVLDTLSMLTGLPLAILNEQERTDLASVREFFSTRVIGQDEAVNAIVDRIAMLKAGLTDPGRPVGVFLFAGPTGTGKTELAKTLAEYLFGHADRLVRLDMSEFQSSDAVRKIIGASQGDGDGEAQSLIQRVRKQPFAVVLLDEFEKAHWSVWDLFLQVFDDGRLTDSLGQTADFRHTLIILTSNLGATTHQSAGVGFAPRADEFSQAQVLRAVGQSFRPEFVNRLDKVIVFRPLTRERMHGILQKELKKVLERRGLRNREWAVEWEASALEFLLDKGFSATMGARPLRRAIDQYLLAPLAATLVEHRFPSGDQFLFVRSDGQAIQVEFVDPDAPEEAAVGASAPASASASALALALASASPGNGKAPRDGELPTVPAIILQPVGSAAEHRALLAFLAAIRGTLDGRDWNTLHETMSARMLRGDFWDDPGRHRVLARYALMDRVRAASRTAESLNDRYRRSGRAPSGPYSRDLAGRLALQLHLVALGIQDALNDAPIEVVLSVEPAMESGTESEGAQAWCQQVASMYRSWATRRRMNLTAIESGKGEPTLLLVAGFGAHAVLANEAGLHVLETDLPASRASGAVSRAVARVRVVSTMSDTTTAPTAERELGADALRKRLSTEPPSSYVVRRYRFEPSPLVRDARGGWRSGRVQDVLAGNFDLFGSIAE